MALVCPKCGENNAAESKTCGMCGDLLPKAAAPKVVTPRPNAPRGAVPQQPRPVNAPGTPPTPRPRTPVRQPVVYMEYAGFWLRFAAALIDFLILTPIMLPICLVLGIGAFIESLLFHSVIPASTQLILLLVPAGILMLYRVLMESSPLQGTLGKVILQIKVTDLAGNRIDIGRAIIRYFALYGVYLLGDVVTIYSGVALIRKITIWYPAISCLFVALSDTSQGIHDSMAGTLVVKK